MLPINYSRYKYSPDMMPKEEFIERFIVRYKVFKEIFDDIVKEMKIADYKVPNQHYIIVGQRGQGKTTLLRKLQIEIEQDKKLSKFLLPVRFAEEQYNIRSLSRLWEEVADYLQSIYEDEFPHVLDDMEAHFDDEDYELKAFSYLDTALKKKKKKLLLLIDNIDELIGKLHEKEQRRLREILLGSSSFRIVGGSTKMLEQHYDYGKPFYEFFKIIKLKGLTKKESIVFLRALGSDTEKKCIEEIIKTNPARIETLRQLTGGVPRTLVMLFDIFLDEGGNAFDDLLKVLDEATPLYKHRIDELPSQLQEIVHTIAINWDGMYTAEIAKKTRLSTKVISAQLGKLEKYDIVESEPAGKNKIYKIKERFFNIWYLMRFGRKKDRQRVEWLVRFLESWCTQEELDERAENLIGKINEGDVGESYVYYMTEALGYTGINLNIEDRLKQEAEIYFQNLKSDYSNSLSKSQLTILMSYLKIATKDDNYKRTIDDINKSRLDGRIKPLLLDVFSQLNSKKIAIEELKNKTRIIHDDTRIEIELMCSLLYNKKEELSFAEMINELNSDFSLMADTQAMICLCYNKFNESEKFYLEYIQGNNNIIFSEVYLSLLLSKYQYHQAKNILENKEFNLKEKYKPIWYALMTLMQDDFPYEIKKMGAELQESVDEVLRKVEAYRVKYAID